MIFRVMRDGFEKAPVRFLETHDHLKVGMFVRIEDGDGPVRGDCLIVEISPAVMGWGTLRYDCLWMLPLKVQENLPAYTLIPKLKN